MYTSTKITVSLAVGMLASFSLKYGGLVLLVCGAIIFDLVTGLLKARISHTIHSNKGWIGFWKKIALFVALAFGFFLDALEFYLVFLNTGAQPNFQISFAMVIGVYIILNESISICENLVECGVTLPAFLQNILQNAKNNLDKSKGDEHLK